MEKKNFMFHKGCPLSNKNKLYLVLHAKMCNQLEDNFTGQGMKVNYTKINPNWNWNDPTSQRYNFPDCENCTMNVYEGISGYSGISKKPSILRKFRNWVGYMRRVF